MPTPKTPPTPYQWAHIFAMLEGGKGAVQRAYAWLQTEVRSDMSQRTFDRLLSIERETRRLQREAALAATPAVPLVDGRSAVPLGASLLEEDAAVPPAAHGGAMAPPERSEDDAQRTQHVPAQTPAVSVVHGVGPALEQAADYSRSDEQPCSPSDAFVEGSDSSVAEAEPSTSAAVGPLAEIVQACNSQSAPGDTGHAAHPSKLDATATEMIGLKHAREEAASAVPAPASKAARPDASDSELSGAAATSESGAVRHAACAFRFRHVRSLAWPPARRNPARAAQAREPVVATTMPLQRQLPAEMRGRALMSCR